MKSTANGIQKHQKSCTTSGFSVQSFEAARHIVLIYRDELIPAKVLMQGWVTACIDDVLKWAESLVEHGLYEQVAGFIPAKLFEAHPLVENCPVQEENDIRTKKGSDEETKYRNIDIKEL